jgi:TldD protein
MARLNVSVILEENGRREQGGMGGGGRHGLAGLMDPATWKPMPTRRSASPG